MNTLGKLSFAFFFVSFSTVGWGWVRPESPSQIGAMLKPSRFEDLLDYVLLEVNGASRVVKNGQELAIVRGDTLVIKEAVLRNERSSPKEVQVFGLMRNRQGRSEARGLTFQTRDLASRFSEAGKGEVYAVIARSKKLLHGTFYIRIQEATLRYAEVLINDSKHILRDGEALKLSPKDMFKLNRVVTNLDSDDGVLFQIAEGSRGERAIRFLRHGVAFATIPLIIEE